MTKQGLVTSMIVIKTYLCGCVTNDRAWQQKKDGGKRKSVWVICSAPRDPSKFMMSDHWLLCYMHNTIGWSFRRSTKAAQTLPDDWVQQKTDMLSRAACLVKLYSIVPEMVFMADETHVLTTPAAKGTWHETGARNVPIFGAEEKAALTVMITNNAAGEVLPMQVCPQHATVVTLSTSYNRSMLINPTLSGPSFPTDDVSAV